MRISHTPLILIKPEILGIPRQDAWIGIGKVQLFRWREDKGPYFPQKKKGGGLFFSFAQELSAFHVEGKHRSFLWMSLVAAHP